MSAGNILMRLDRWRERGQLDRERFQTNESLAYQLSYLREWIWSNAEDVIVATALERAWRHGAKMPESEDV